LTAATNETVEYGGKLFSFVAGGVASDVPGANQANWVSLSGGASSAIASSFGGLATSRTGAVLAEAANDAPAGTYFATSPWQRYQAGTNQGTVTGTPTKNNGGMIDRTAEYTDVSNTSKWTKTHYTHLQGTTVGTSYTRGDNIFYQGKNYIYTSHLDSDDALYVSPSDDGYTEFGDLLRLGAIQEVPMHIDTVGGGGAPGTPDDIYFRPNQNLKFVDRLPGSGDVRASNMARRTDAPLPPGDEIFNSPDDAFFGGLQAGNDGIYGTMDDFYASTSDPAMAQASAHLDADADNNKDLLDTANGLENFSVADFVDYIQTLANVRAVNGGTMSRLGYAERILEENEINLGAATSRIMDADMAYESTKMARQNVLVQAAASMVTQANSLNNVVLSLLQ
jgi:flagellin-like hook-associated protein FlgL